MKKFLFPLFMMLMVGVSFGFYSQDGDFLSVDKVQLDDVYLAGESVNIYAELQEDAFIAGNQVDINGKIGKDLFVAGNIVNINGDVSDDLKAAGSLITVVSTIKDDAFVVGSSITLAPSANIGGDLLAAGSLISFDGKAKNARLLGETVKFAGIIAGDCVIQAEMLNISPNAQILGNLKISEELITDELKAIVAGEITPIEIEISGGMIHEFKGSSWFYTFGRIFLIAILFLFTMPKYFKKSTEAIAKKPRKMLLHGFLIYAIMPIAILILFITVIGIPLALFSLFAYIFLLAFTKLWVVVFGTGLIQKYVFKSKDKAKTKKMQENPRIKLAIIAVLSAVIVFVPFIVALILSLFAMGSGFKNDMKMLKKYK